MYLPASRRVRSVLPSSSLIGSSNARPQPTSANGDVVACKEASA